MVLQEDLYLEVPYEQRFSAKQAGAAPLYRDKKFICWYVPAGNNIEPFKDWWPEHLKNENSGTDGPKGVSLYSYLNRVKMTVSNAFTQSEWVIAEITNITGSNHKYFELTDYDDRGSEKAKVRGALWASRTGIMDRFAQETGLQLKPSMKVLMKVQAEYDPKYGASVTIHDIDSRFTIGEMEAKLNRIRSELQQKGIYNSNKNFTQKLDYFRVAVIAPEGAAGLGDFLTQSNQLAKHGVVKFDYFTATFQGHAVVGSLVSALDSVVAYQSNNNFSYDAVCIIRGGGDKAGLYALNEYQLAERVATMPIPVFTGIGHERDTTVLDEVAFQRFPTPSMVVGHIMQTVVNGTHAVQSMKAKLEQAASSVVARSESQLVSDLKRLETSAQRVVEISEAQIKSEREKLFLLAESKVDQAEVQAKDLYRRLMVNNPMSVLERGYSIVRQNGQVIGKVNQLVDGEASLRLQDGEREIIIRSV